MTCARLFSPHRTSAQTPCAALQPASRRTGCRSSRRIFRLSFRARKSVQPSALSGSRTAKVQRICVFRMKYGTTMRPARTMHRRPQMARLVSGLPRTQTDLFSASLPACFCSRRLMHGWTERKAARLHRLLHCPLLPARWNPACAFRRWPATQIGTDCSSSTGCLYFFGTAFRTVAMHTRRAISGCSPSRPWPESAFRLY